MFRLLSRMKRLERREEGFSMAEVVMATLLFTASVVGISGMLISGGANVNRGAKESAAANLAARRLEEVKSMPFYLAWGGTNADIDDTYYNASYPNGVAGDENQHPQLDHPAVVENYGQIPGFPQYKRTTAIEYQYRSNLGGTNHLAPAVMYSKWVPKNPGTSQTDVPKGGANSSVSDDLHALLIEVKVYYRTESGEKVYKEQALAGDLMVTGGTNNPVLYVDYIDTDPSTKESPDGVHGWTDDNDVDLKIYVRAQGLSSSSQLEVKLWYAGRPDIHANGEVANANGTVIDCWFDLTQPGVYPGVYNLSVYWKDEGWEDKHLRECFTVKSPPPVITGIDSYDWSYRALSDRQVTIRGQNLSTPTHVQFSGPNEGGNQVILPASVVSSAPTYIVVHVNCTPIPADSFYYNKRWNAEVTTPGGYDKSNKNSERLLMNPKPVITGISPTSSYTGTRAGNQYSVTLNGTYFQNSPSAVYLTRSFGGPPSSGQTYLNIKQGTPTVNAAGTQITGLTARVYVNPTNNSFMQWPGTTPATNANTGGTYYVYYQNADGQWADIASGVTLSITHATYTVSVGTSPAGWGTVSGAGTYYQDETCTLTPNYTLPYEQRTWQEPPGTDLWTTGPWSFEVTQNRNIHSRGLKWLYYGDYVSNPNQASFVQGYANSPYDTPNFSYVEGSYRVMKLRSKANWGDPGEIAGKTSSIQSFSGCDWLHIYWVQQDGNNNGAANWAAMCISSNANGDYNDGRVAGSDDVFDYRWDSVSVTGRPAAYIHINSHTNYSILGGNSTNVRVRYLFLTNNPW